MKIINAAKSGEISAIEELISEGENIHEVDEDGRSALHWAAINGHKELVVWLVREKNIPIDVKDNEGRTAFFESCGESQWSTAFACLENGASPDCYAEGTAPLLMAAASLNTELVEKMIKSNADLKVKREGTEENALHFAAMAESDSAYDNLALMKKLYTAGVPISSNSEGYTPYTYLGNVDRSFVEMFHEYVDPTYHSQLLSK